jgi:hypothetical protein
MVAPAPGGSGQYQRQVAAVDGRVLLRDGGAAAQRSQVPIELERPQVQARLADSLTA